MTQETEDTVTITFETDGQPFPYRPGQFVNLRQIIGGEEILRSYSLSSAPGEDEKPAITIKKVEGGRMSNFIFRHARDIRVWEVDGPHGAFYAVPEATGGHPVVLIGGGSGITPLYSMLQAFLKHSGRPILVIDCNRSWKDVVFAGGITRLEQQYADRLQVHHFLSRETGTAGLPCRNARAEKLSRLVLKKTLKKFLGASTRESEYFLCGPGGLMKLATEVLHFLEVPAGHIHQEDFAPAAEEPVAIALPRVPKEVLLHYYEQSNLLEVQSGKTILEAALEDRVPLGYSCKNGTCGRCAARQTAGRVHMRKNNALTEEEVNGGFILLCQSHPLDDAVEVIIE
ncbi:ferredoxin--NADP reductase [Paraflavisolibacter sp. H34]|uniref:ferredoxin--NADP reductase n=1 Tax=Huijunlia imazamoxiresistens TaxID=3127457 RepID=UPI003016B448